MQIGIVMQEPILFNYTVKENILYGNNLAKLFPKLVFRITPFFLPSFTINTKHKHS